MNRRSAGRPPRSVTWAQVLTTALVGVVVADATLALFALTRFDAQVLLDNFIITSAVIGLSLALCGGLITFSRPSNAVGWLLLAAGVLYGATAGIGSALGLGLIEGESARRAALTLALASWPAAITGLLPAALVLFPTGRVISRGWWAVLAACAGFAALATLTLMVMTEPDFALAPGLVGYAPITDPAILGTLGAIQGPLAAVAFGGAVGSLAWRYFRGDDVIRSQVLWVFLAAILTFGGMLAGTVFVIPALFVVVLIPGAIAIAIVRHRLFDIRLVVSRTVLYLAMGGLSIGAYLAVVVAVNWLLQTQAGLGGSLLATVAVAIAFNPVRVQLGRAVDRLFYGTTHDPAVALREMGTQLRPGGTGIVGSLEALCRSLKLPWARLSMPHSVLAAWGTGGDQSAGVAVDLPGAHPAELRVGLRRGESQLTGRDRRTLALLAVPLASAITSLRLADQLEQSRAELLTARRDERARLRRDLHDGLGPTLTAIVLKSDAARRLAPTDQQRAIELMAQVRADATELSGSVRGLIEALRPPALDSLGLVQAIEREAARLGSRGGDRDLRVSVDAIGCPAVLDPDVETAIYRVATEAITNVSRHSTATEVTIRLAADDATVRLDVRDNGVERTQAWSPGVGLLSMRQRAVELGGNLLAHPSPSGGRVSLVLPLCASPPPGAAGEVSAGRREP